MKEFNLSNLVRKENLSGWIVLHGLSNALPDFKEFSAAMDKFDTEDGIVAGIELKIAGVEIDFSQLCEDWESDMNRLVKKQAEKLVSEKFQDLETMLMDLEQRIKPEIEKRLEDWELDEYNKAE